MKKIIKFLCLVLLLSTVVVCQTTISIEDKTGTIGNTVAISVSSTSVSNVKDFTFHIRYDPNSVEFKEVDISGSPLPNSDDFLMYIEEDGVVAVSYFNSEPLTLNGKLFDMKFKFLDNFSEFRFDYARVRDWQGKRIDLTLNNGSLAESTDPNIKVYSPNGGEVLEVVGDPQDITWASVYLTDVEIDYTTDDGVTWTDIADNFDATQAAYSWTVPSITSNQCKIRIISSADSSVGDTSDNVFTINSTAEITALTPNGGEVLKVGGVKRIKWTDKNITNVKIEYSANANNATPTWNTIITSTPASIGYYDWTIPNTPSVNCKIRLSDASNPGANDLSDAAFEITTAPVNISLADVVEATLTRVIKVNSAGNRAYLWGGSWETENNPFTLENGEDLYFSDTLIVRGTVPLTVGWLTSVKYFVMQVAFNPETVIPDTLIPTQDIGVCSYSVRDNILTITWYNSNPIDIHGKMFDLRFTYSDMIDPNQWIDSALWAINPFTSNPFAVGLDPTTPSVTLDPAQFSELKIVSFEVENLKGELISDLAFTDGSLALTNSSAVKLLSPIGGETWGVSDGARNIEWESVLTDSVSLKYSTNNGGSWIDIITGIPASTGAYNWTLPNVNSSTCKIQITNAAAPAVADVSGTFTITNTKSVGLLTPNGGETLKSGSEKDIKWNSTNVTDVKLEYTLDDGTSWFEIDPSVSALDNIYTWLVPDTVSSLAKVKISDASDAGLFDESDNVFTIASGLTNVSIPDTNVVSGDHSIPINTEWLNDVAYINLRIEYDTTAITFDRVEASSQLENSGYFTSSIRGGMISAIWLASTPIDVHGSLFHLFYNYNESAIADLSFISGTIQNSAKVNLAIQLNDGSVSPPPTPISIPSVVDASSENIIPIDFGTIRTITSMDLEIKYDEESLNLKEVKTNTQELSSFTYSSNSGIVRIGWSGNTLQNLGGELFEMKFEYNPNAEPTDNQFSEFRFKKVDIKNDRNRQIGVLLSEGSLSQNENPALKLYAPNGGEVWNSGTSPEKIEWGSVFVNSLSIYLTTDDGRSWETVCDSLNVENGYYDWYLPNVTSDQCKIKIMTDEDNEIYDESEQSFTITPVTGVDNKDLPNEFNLEQNFPNPFNPSTKIRYALPVQAKVNLTVFNLLGQKVETIVDEMCPAGFHEVNWRANNYASGIYFYRLIAGDYVKTKKMIILK